MNKKQMKMFKDLVNFNLDENGSVDVYAIGYAIGLDIQYGTRERKILDSYVRMEEMKRWKLVYVVKYWNDEEDCIKYECDTIEDVQAYMLTIDENIESIDIEVEIR